MNISALHAIGIIAVTAVCTLLIRAVPFLIFGGNRRAPEVIHYLGRVLPAAIMTTLVVYCLKNIHITTGTHAVPELFCVLLVAGLHWWKKNILLSVGLGTVCYMFLVQTVFM